MAVGNQASYQIDRKVRWAAMAGMCNLHEVLELVKHRFDQRPPTQDYLFMQEQQAVRHIPFEVGDQAQLAGLP